MNLVTDCLFIIPARAGSKGLPGKNIRLLAGKPLVQYSIDYARQFVDNERICVTTDDDRIIQLAKDQRLEIPFKRPAELASDTASASDVIKHAVNFYRSKGLSFNKVVYLQPTSPFRKRIHLEEAFTVYNSGSYDMVVSVCETSENPYFSLFEETTDGYLNRSKELPSGILRRQDAPKVYAYNGSIYIINVDSLRQANLHELKKIKKYEMAEIFATDIDTELDWKYAEFLLSNNLIPID